MKQKRKNPSEDLNEVMSHGIQNKLLHSTTLTSRSATQNNLLIMATYNPITKPLSLKNSILAGTSLSSKPLYHQKQEAKSSVMQHYSYHISTKKADTEKMSKKQAETNKMDLSLDSWSNLASFDEHFDFSADVPTGTQSVQTTYSCPRNFFNEYAVKNMGQTRRTKAEFLQFVASSLVDGGVLKRVPGRCTFVKYLQDLSNSDPEFILKCALYCRRELNIRTTANALLACSCYDKSCYPFLDKYFSSIVSLPSDWIEVAEYFKAMTTPSSKKLTLPKPLRRNMIAKFAEFDEYQLAKHNKEKGRVKRATKAMLTPAVTSSEASHPFINMKQTYLTIKYLIRVLHIHRPTFPVMCILRKKYPSSATEFVRLGLEGDWDSTLANKPMKLPTPVTWETELSKSGNNATTWKSLIISNQVPFMAMLRNLRNIIKTGVSESVRNEVIKKLTNPSAVKSSKLFPFRFFTAYVVLDELERDLKFNNYLFRLQDGKRRRINRCTPLKLRINKKEKKYLDSIAATGIKPLRYTLSTLQDFREALGKAIAIAVHSNLPPIRGNTLIVCYFQSKARNQKAIKQLQAAGLGSNLIAIGTLLASMCASICESSTTYVSLHSTDQCYAASDLTRSEQSTKLDSGQNILHQAESLLRKIRKLPSFNLECCLEDFIAVGYHFDTVYLIGDMCPAVANFVSFQRAQKIPVNAVWSNLSGADLWCPAYGDKSNWVIMKGPTDQVLRYIAEASDKGLVDRVERIDELYGLTKPLCLQFPNDQLQSASAAEEFHVDRPITTHWRCCRIFISSTFRDMHAERDLICGVIMPALRQYAVQELRVHILDVDLRWGVPESSTRSSQALEMCLEQAMKSDLFVLLVGNRYGWTPKRALLDVLPERLREAVAKVYVPNMSVTELEYNMAKYAIKSRVAPSKKRSGLDAEREAVRSRLFAFIRDPDSLNGIPEEHALEFNETTEVKRQRLNGFKSTLRKDGVLVLDNYPAWFNGLIANRPVMGNLSVFGNELNRTLRDALNKLYKREDVESLRDQSIELPYKCPSITKFVQLYIEPVAASIAPRQLLSLKRAVSDMTKRGEQCHSLRLLAAEQARPSFQSRQLKQNECDGTIMLISGSLGSGKTTHLAALAMLLSKPHWTPLHGKRDTEFTASDSRSALLPRSIDDTVRSELPPHRIFVHFAGGLTLTGLPPKMQLLSLLSSWTDQLFAEIQLAAHLSTTLAKEINEIRDEANLNVIAGMDALLKSKMICLSKLINLLRVFPKRYYAFLLDSADHLKPPLFDWLPTVLPGNVRFLLTCDTQSAVTRSLSNRPDCLVFTVSRLSLAERSAAVRVILGRYGKTLDESGFRNQLSLLVNKRNADIPLYLKLACEELRLYGTYEELDAQLKKLPDTIPSLVRHIVARAEAQCGSELVLMTLALIACSRKPLSSVELHMLLDAWLQDRQGRSREEKSGPDWQELITLKSTESEPCDQMLSLEQAIQRLVVEDRNMTSAISQKPVHIPSLAFHVLLSEIRPLLAGLGDDGELTTTEVQPYDLLEESRQLGLIRLRNAEVVELIQDICFNKNKSSLSSFSRLGYYKPTSVMLSSSSSTAKRLRPTVNSEDLSESARAFSGTVDQKYIHWLLARNLSGLEHKIYHFFHAGQLDVVLRLLQSPTFLIERLRSGHSSFLLEDYQGYTTSDVEIQSDWMELFLTGKSGNMLSAMRQFLATHTSILTKYPFLFHELAANYEADAWIRQLGLLHIQSSLESKWDSEPDRIRFFLRRSETNANTRLQGPCAVHHPTEMATAVTVSPDGHVIAYGTQNGTVNLIDSVTMREIRSFYGHGGAVLSLCFLTDYRTSTRTGFRHSETECCLVSTAQDQTICLWLVPHTVDQPGTSNSHLNTGRRLTSWTGPQKQSVTCSAWHPDQGLLATGSLDCTVVLWKPPRTVQQLEASRAHSNAVDSAPPSDYKILRTDFSPVSSVAFRLPSDTATKPQNDLAVGCWDGIIRIFDAISLRKKMSVSVSTCAICSLDYSVSDDGAVLATQDLKGELLLLHSDKYSPLVHVQNSNLDYMETLTDRSLETWLFRRGQLCFSRPSGRYLVQSGGAGAEGGQLILWNAQLGAQINPWNSSQPWQVQNKPLHRIVACAADPFGHILLVGGNEGRLAVICAQSGRMLTRADDPLCRMEQDSQVQIASCTILSPKNPTADTTEFKYLGLFGTSSGMLRAIVIMIKLNWSDTSSGDCRLELTGFLDNGSIQLSQSCRGLLCVDTTSSLAAVGSEGAEGFVLLQPRSSVQSRAVKTIHDMGGSAVTSTAVRGKFCAFGTKSGCIYIYRKMKTDTVEHVHTIYAAANDWITALSWGSLHGLSTPENSLFLVAGSNDQFVRIYVTEEDNAFQLSNTLQGPGGRISTASTLGSYIVVGSLEGRVRLWQLSKRLAADELTTIDLSTENSEVERSGQPSGLICTRLFSQLTTRKSESKSESDSEDEEFSPLARIHVDRSSSSLLSISDSVDASQDEPMDIEESGDSKSVTQAAEILKSNREVVRTQGKNASKLRLIVGQEVLVADVHNMDLARFRFRTYAPLVPEKRAVLEGHRGLIANSLSTATASTEVDDKCLLVSVAQSSKWDGQNSSVGCDLRLWSLPPFGTQKQDVPIRHNGPITSIATVFSQNRAQWFVSAGGDGSLIFWRLENPSSTKQRIVSSQTKRLSWIPAFLLLCSNVQITCVVACKPPVLTDFVCVCFAVGHRLIVLCLHEQLLHSLEWRQSMHFEQLVRMADPSTSSARVGYAQLTLPNPVMHISFGEQTDQDSLQLVLSNANGTLNKVAVKFTTSSVEILNLELIPFTWSIPSSALGRSAYSLDYHSAQGVNNILRVNHSEGTENDSTAKVTLTNGQTIHLIEPVFPSESGKFESMLFLVVGELNQTSVVQLMAGCGRVFAQLEPIPYPLMVTAICSLATVVRSASWYFAIATSDGFIRLMKHEDSQPETFVQVGLCPTGERVTMLQLLEKSPLQLAVGTQSGNVLVYEII